VPRINPNVTKKELVEEISLKTGLTKVDAKMAVEEFFNTITDMLADRRTIEIRYFGVFKVKDRKARPARNPIAGTVVPIPAHVAPVLKFSKFLRKDVDDAHERRKAGLPEEPATPPSVKGYRAGY